MQKWEIMKIWLPTDVTEKPVQVDKETGHMIYSISWGEEFKKKWAEAEALGEEGWELVGIASETTGHEVWWTPYPAQKCLGSGSSYTTGYFMVFKRPKQP